MGIVRFAHNLLPLRAEIPDQVRYDGDELPLMLYQILQMNRKKKS
jgi:hypothetical protein